jgi:hypothetical protein
MTLVTIVCPVDVLAEAQISQFNNPNLDPYAVPEPSSFVLLTVGSTVLIMAGPGSRLRA